jgi:hypothetical protein
VVAVPETTPIVHGHNIDIIDDNKSKARIYLRLFENPFLMSINTCVDPVCIKAHIISRYVLIIESQRKIE